jgi:hypothetical protein
LYTDESTSVLLPQNPSPSSMGIVVAPTLEREGERERWGDEVDADFMI